MLPPAALPAPPPIAVAVPLIDEFAPTPPFSPLLFPVAVPPAPTVIVSVELLTNKAVPVNNPPAPPPPPPPRWLSADPPPAPPATTRYSIVGVTGGVGICTAVNAPFILTPEIVSAILFF
jgi:hypothetical protein